MYRAGGSGVPPPPARHLRYGVSTLRAVRSAPPMVSTSPSTRPEPPRGKATRQGVLFRKNLVSDSAYIRNLTFPGGCMVMVPSSSTLTLMSLPGASSYVPT